VQPDDRGHAKGNSDTLFKASEYIDDYRWFVEKSE
jgi:hypothetical protein